MNLAAKIFLLNILLILLSSPFYAQYESKNIKGIITNEANVSLPYVNVFILDSFDGAMSDEEGEFLFTTAKYGEVELIASLIGFEKLQQTIELDTLSNNPLHITGMTLGS